MKREITALFNGEEIVVTLIELNKFPCKFVATYGVPEKAGFGNTKDEAVSSLISVLEYNELLDLYTKCVRCDKAESCLYKDSGKCKSADKGHKYGIAEVDNTDIFKL